MGDQSAADAALGYYYQGAYALIVLLDADDTSKVSLETSDDITLGGSGPPTLLQLKHSMGKPPPLTCANVGFWKAIGNWIASADDAKCVFVTCANIDPSSVLMGLVPTALTSRGEVVKELSAEAKKVVDSRANARTAKDPLPHKGKGKHCEAFHALLADAKLQLVQRISILDSSSNLAGVEGLVDARLRPMVEPLARVGVRRRLLEWWDNRVSRSLLNETSREISMVELQRHLAKYIRDADPERLPDGYHGQKPTTTDVLFAETMAAQIHIVDGGNSRLSTAGLARWRALEQRAKWLEDDASLASELQDYDEMLKERWSELHGPLVDDTEGLPEKDMRTSGRTLLDWALRDAAHSIEPIRPGWIRPFLVMGTLQDLANRKDVGWHPNYLNCLNNEVEGEE